MRRNYFKCLFVFIGLLFFLSNLVFGDSVVVDWTSTYNSPNNSWDEGRGIAVDSAGNVYVIGYEYRDDLGQSFNIWTRKYDSNGFEIWTSTYNSPNNGDDVGYGIAVDSSGNVYVTGAEGRNDLGQGWNIWTRKYDTNGFEIWTSTYNSPNNGSDFGHGIAVDNAGNVYVIGDEYRDDLGQRNNIWTRKYDSNGFEIWTSTYNSPNNGDEYGKGIAVDSSGNVYVIGTENRSDLGQSWNIWTRKYDSNGFEIWTSTYNSPNSSEDDGEDIAVDNMGNVYVTGTELRSDLGQGWNIWTRKYDSNGYEIWTSTYNSPNNSFDCGNGIAVDSAGNVYVIGYEDRGDLGQYYNIWTSKYDTNGNEIWTRTYNSPNNGDDVGYGIAVDSSGNVYVTGIENRSDLGQDINIWTRKYKVVYNISGTITDGVNPIPDVTVSIIKDGTPLISTTSDTSGNYSFYDLDAGSNYVVKPIKNHWTFIPVEWTYTNLSKDEEANYLGNLNTCFITGNITEDGNPLEGVIVSLIKDGTNNDTTTTNSSGEYVFSDLIAGSTYVIEPSKEHYSFIPVKRTYSDLSSNVYNADFVGRLKIWSISGTITDMTKPIYKVTVSLSGDSTASTITDKNGNYSFNNLSDGVTYIITPSKKHYKFTPENATFPDLDGNETQDFIGEKTWHKNLDNSTAYPNPCKGDSVKFNNLTINCTIRVYSIRGELVFEAKSDLPEYEWQVINDNNKKIVSGVYIFVITNENGEQKKGKIAVIR